MAAHSSEKLERQAIHWLVKMQSRPDDSTIEQACQLWRQHSPAHEEAWLAVQASFGLLQHQISRIPGNSAPEASRALIHSASRMNRRRALGQLGMLMAVAAPLGWIVREHTPWQRLRADYTTPTGERLELTLADGSRLMLNTDSAVRLRFDEQQRLVLLDRGEIYLDNSADTLTPSRPMLTVHTDDAAFEAGGSRFSIRQLPDASRLVVANGSVDAQGLSMARPRQTTAGDMLELTRLQAVNTAPSGMDPLAWLDGQLVAQDMRLADFLDEVARYRPGRLGWTQEVADMRLSGTYQLSDTDRLLALLPQVLPLAIDQRTRYWTTVRARA